MTLQEKIQKKAEGFGKLAPVFLEGAKFALENKWISVKDDLPCNHKELLQALRFQLKRKHGMVMKLTPKLTSSGYLSYGVKWNTFFIKLKMMEQCLR